jgi:hypothetical protein
LKLLSFVLLLVSISLPTLALAQVQQQDWVPSGIEALGHNASSRSDFTLNHSMLVLASKLDKNDDGDLRRVIAGVNGVSVHSYRFSQSGTYDPDTLKSVLQQYHEAGWMQLVGSHSKDGSAGQTDLWVRFDNNAISNIAVLIAKQDQLNFFAVSGSISPLDLVHLSGHFGIPKIAGGAVIPGPANTP